MINSITIVGRATKDTEFDMIKGNSFAKNSIAFSEYWKKDNETIEHTNFIDIQAWGKLAEVMRNYVSKGKLIGITGKIKQERWEGQDNKKMSRHIIRVEVIELLSPNTNENFTPDKKEEISQKNDIPTDDEIF